MAPVVQSVTYYDDPNSGEMLDDVTLSVPKPAGTVLGDLLVAFPAYKSNNTTVEPVFPSGWTRLDWEHNLNVGHAFGWKEAGAAEPGTYDFLFSGLRSRSRSVGILRISGHKSGDPISIFESSQAIDPPLLSPDVLVPDNDSRVFRNCAYARSNLIDDPFLDEHWNELSSGGATARHSSACRSEIQATAGQSGTYDWIDPGSERHTTLSFAVAPESGPQPAFKPEFAHPFTH